MKRRVILIVDNDELMQQTVSGLTSHMGHKTCTASSSSEALEIVKKFPIDLIITDLEMPGGNGDILLSNLRAEKILIPSILMTGAVSIDEAAAIKIGAEGFLKKPFSNSDLCTEIEKVFNIEKQKNK